MTARTPEDARQWLCPLARTFAAPTAEPGCRGPSCALWRWSTSGKWAGAVKAVAAEIDDKAPFPKASRIVADDPAKYGCGGFCGLGGTP